MKQLLQSFKNGESEIVEAPDPSKKEGYVTVQSRCSLISAGTERMLVNFGKASMIEKARQQPEKVKMVIDKIQSDGLVPTVEAVKSKLDQPIPMGYSSVGVVFESGVSGIKEGDRVVSNGSHASMVSVPKHLMAKIPDSVTDDHAVFTVVSSIALQGIRLAAPTLGEFVVVTGVGLIGLIAVQLLVANGCKVLAIDYDDEKLVLAEKYGAHTCNAKDADPVQVAEALTQGIGVDAVLITASTTSNEPVSQAALMCRQRGRIILVGVAGLELNRSDFYEKELTFQVSCSYGPGRYDENYEAGGNDYPIGFVRWTEQRNMEAVLHLMSSGALDVSDLISHRFKFEDAAQAYEVVTGSRALGVMLDYDYVPNKAKTTSVTFDNTSLAAATGQRSVTFVGAGNYASRVLIPAFKNAEARLVSLVSQGGINASFHGKKLGFAKAASQIDDAIKDDVAAMVIATRHDSHASLAEKVLKANKHVFVEKPLALTMEELCSLKGVYEAQQTQHAGPMLMVGYNRRFSPLSEAIKTALSSFQGPKTFIMTMNAGDIPADHWVHDPELGGGRIIGEACHYVDLMRHFAGCEITNYHAVAISEPDSSGIAEDKAIITLTFADGSIGTIQYFANGSAKYPKERVEVFAGGAVLQIDNFKKLKSYGWKDVKDISLFAQDKGQKRCASLFMDAVENGGHSPIPVEEVFEVAKATIGITEMIRTSA